MAACGGTTAYADAQQVALLQAQAAQAAGYVQAYGGYVQNGAYAPAQMAVAGLGQVVPPPPPAAAAVGAQQGSALVVSGCANEEVGRICRGQFLIAAENHGRYVFKKHGQVTDGHDVLIYFWDDRDGAAFCGWWFGPRVGGDQVWAYNPERSQMPPAGGWRVPYDGPVDPSFVLAGAGGQAAYGYQEQRTVIEGDQVNAELAVHGIRRALQELRMQPPEKLPLLLRQVEEMAIRDLPKCGAYAMAMQEEVRAALTEESLRAQRVKDEQMRVELQRQAEREDVARQLLGQFAMVLDKAERTSERLGETTRPLTEAPPTLESAAAVRTAADAVSADAKEATTECLSFLLQSRHVIQQAWVAKELTGSQGAVEVERQFLAFLQRSQDCLKLVNSSLWKAHSTHTRLVKKQQADVQTVKLKTVFEKYDEDKDGMLNALEIAAYSKGEFAFEVSEEATARFMKLLASKGKAGIPFEKLHRLKSGIGVEREGQRVSRHKASLQAKIEELEGALKAGLHELNDEIAKAESEANRASSIASTATGVVQDEVDEVDGTVTTVSQSLQDCAMRIWREENTERIARIREIAANLQAYRSHLHPWEEQVLPQVQLMRKYYRVVKEVVLTNNALVEGSSAIRTLELEEVLEAKEAPYRDDTVGILRMRAQAARDKSEGWVTIQGNKDSTYLEPCRSELMVILSDWTNAVAEFTGLVEFTGWT